MVRQLLRGRKRCPFCKLTDIYKRSRRKDRIIREHHTHKNHDLKAYICLNCKYEFDVPFEA